MGAQFEKVFFGDKAAQKAWTNNADVAQSNGEKPPSYDLLNSGMVGIAGKLVAGRDINGPAAPTARLNAADGKAEMVAGEMRLGSGDLSQIRNRQAAAAGTKLLGG